MLDGVEGGQTAPEVVESTVTETAASTPEQTSSAEPAQSGEKTAAAADASTSAAASDAGKQAAVVVPPAFVPNHKFKVHDTEHEIPEAFRALVKDAKTEKEVKEIFEKAYGLDFVKPKFEKTRQELEAVQTKVQKEYQPLVNNIQQAAYFLKQKDYDSLFEHIGVPKDEVLGWVHQKLQEMELPPQLQAQLEQTRKINRDNWNLMQQNQVLSQQMMTRSEQETLSSLQTVLAKPDVKTVAEAYDARTGKPGSFMRECINRGEYFELKGQNLTPEQVVSELLAVIGPIPSPSQGLQGVSGTAVGAQQGNQQAMGTKSMAPPPVIPNVGGQNTSPTKKLPRSIEDLRKKAREYSSQV